MKSDTIPLRKRSLRQRKSKPPTSVANVYARPPPCPPTMPPMKPPQSSDSTTSSTATAVAVAPSYIAKPMRPLTAYHIFFQIEREYIIQMTPGSTTEDSTSMANKSYQRDVPTRYRKIKLLSDWYAGPGKRKKRKHRKSHGKIGFLELSAAISKRWKCLDVVDPETKRYVARIAARELDAYKAEMVEYKKKFSESPPPSPPAAAAGRGRGAKHGTAAAKGGGRAAVTPRSSPSASPSAKTRFARFPADVPSSSGGGMPCLMIPHLSSKSTSMLSGDKPMECPDLVLSQHGAATGDDAFVFDEKDDVIDYSICCVSNNGHYIPSPPSPVYGGGDDAGTADAGSICDPLFELESEDDDCLKNEQLNSKSSKRCVSPVVSSSSKLKTGALDGFVHDGRYFQLSMSPIKNKSCLS